MIQKGDYYRLASWDSYKLFDAWEAAKDGSEALLTYVQVLAVPNVHSKVIRLAFMDYSNPIKG